jgi:hypothetical protein
MYKMNAFIRDDALASINEVIFFLVVDFFFDAPLPLPRSRFLVEFSSGTATRQPLETPEYLKNDEFATLCWNCLLENFNLACFPTRCICASLKVFEELLSLITSLNIVTAIRLYPKMQSIVYEQHFLVEIL